MRRVEPYAPEHAGQINLNPMQARELACRSQVEVIDSFARGGPSFTLRDRHGAILMIGGLLTVAPGYALGWAFLSAHSGRHMRWITGRVRGYLAMAAPRWRRIEVSARADFAPAPKWARMLGLDFEGTVRAALPDGGDVQRFARINSEWEAAA